ncbi:thioesterase II family protein [Streptomyces uncialis]|uniref:Thioesterase n=1 Tax=Streptomyces uncialis TaxID=1048205 RepID=A0A1Q4V321_9ACTN|nr:thioesterase domain-containing protein [Streptomyces uncialis]OKH92129.1 thioesterase [Streptomyces uncialis]
MSSLNANRVRGQWLLRRPNDAATCRIFCFPYSGVGASMYARWPEWAGSAEVCPIQPPGRENRLAEPHYGTFDALAEQVIPELEPYLDRPFAFFGHCSSALAGFAVANRLAGAGLPVPRRLFVSSQVAPHEPPYGRFFAMSDDELTAELAALTRSMGGEPIPDLLALGLSVMKADIAAHKAYRIPEPLRLPGGVTVIGWDRDEEVRPELMHGWRHYCSDARFITLRGSHHTFLEAPLALMAELADDMRRDLAR